MATSVDLTAVELYGRRQRDGTRGLDAVACVRDTNGDGFADVLVSAPESYEGGLRVGHAYVRPLVGVGGRRQRFADLLIRDYDLGSVGFAERR